MKVEGIGNREHDTDLVTKYSIGAGWGVGVRALSEYRGRNPTGGETNLWDTHKLRRGILVMGDGSG